MRILVDEQLPRQLAPYFVGHDVRTTQEQGWAGLKNGELLKQALSAGFEVLVTGDKNLEFQQNLRSSGLFVVVLVAPSNKLKDLPSASSQSLGSDRTCQTRRSGAPRQLLKARGETVV